MCFDDEVTSLMAVVSHVGFATEAFRLNSAQNSCSVRRSSDVASLTFVELRLMAVNVA